MQAAKSPVRAIIVCLESGKSTDKQLYDAAVLYLANTGLLYRGVT